jgi:HNH endonuclease
MLRKMIARQTGATPSARFCPNCGKELGRLERLTTVAPYLLSEIEYLSKLRRIGEGDIPAIPPSVVLPAEELCYFEGVASYHKMNRTATVLLPGRLIVTNRRIIFSAPKGSGEIPLNKVLNVTKHSSGFFLELSRQANSGFYSVDDPRLTGNIILSAVRLATRQLIAPRERDTRHIPQHLKIQVWQRDQGRCVQCGAAEYLEFDHIIPHSKGGATSLNNLQ